jgi:NADP-dependent 3-hydroxy acid dehydrogenase YdfG
MASIKNKIVFITGASAGIGKATAYAFANEGAKLILSARRIDKVKQVAEDIAGKYNVEVYTLRLDVRNNAEVEETINLLPGRWRNIDILVNNAGLAKGVDKIHQADVNDWDEMIDTNIKGVLYVTRQILPGMVERNSGHIINLGSTAGHLAYPGAGVYCATKFSVRAISDTIRIETADTNVRITSIDPGAVETEFSNVRFNGDLDRARKIYEGFEPLKAEDIAETIIFCATRPEHSNINEIIITSTSQANSLVISRK